MDSRVCDAIGALRIVRLFYDGGFRDVEPHCYGQSSAGDDLLRAYQVGGYSRSGVVAGWKNFRMDRVSRLSVAAGTFPGPRPDYEPNDPAMARIYCRL